MALEFGRIVWAEIADPRGHLKLRPGVIVTPTEQIEPDRPLELVAVTSRFNLPVPEDHVVLPWHPQGHARTKLNRKCAAVCSWLATIQASDIRDLGGVLPGHTLQEILSKIAPLDAEKDELDPN